MKLSVIETHQPKSPFLQQERLIGEIDKLRNEIDHLKRRSGAFGDGTHPRYATMPLPRNSDLRCAGTAAAAAAASVMIIHVLVRVTSGLTWVAPATFASLWWRAKMATTAQP